MVSSSETGQRPKLFRRWNLGGLGDQLQRGVEEEDWWQTDCPTELAPTARLQSPELDKELMFEATDAGAAKGHSRW